ncbi:Pkinase-domain-containing protein [Rhizoclosmatium globosum]|uniref:Pkinase-domain-containing protein n=1 Tax=Rhizoclosmatium globosum TaxID=329046 RepID=A0A1Y2D161_9FUNG|nr:Pkinase-domain-containing protein [Rhizoclosmatium globosum]|eukprot:ORY52947.1 Pkinase-domain-containing protein [Rhizoclosmatium globosum]
MASVNTLEYLLQKYEMGDTLGTGAFSDVKVATERATGNKFAIKIVDKTKCKGKESMIETEVSILMRVKHENIVQLYEMYEIENKIYLVMELVTGGELFDEIVGRGKYSEVDAAKIVYRILLAINYLHGLGIAHRDLKPENLLLSDKTKDAKIMISDFGLSKIFNDDEVMRTACGTPGYVAPEVLRRQGYGREIDLWSLGVITYILLCGYPPFYDQNNVELFKQIMTGKYEFDKPWWDNISDNAKDFIRKLLVLDPHARSTARTALSHPFILEHCGRNSVHQALPQKTAPRPNASTLANQHEQYQQQQQLLHHQQQQQQLLQQQQQQQQNLQLQQKQQQEYYNAQYHQQQVQFQQQQHYAQYQQQQQQQQQQQLQQQQQQQDSATQQPQHGYIYIRDTVSRARRTRPNAEDDQHAQSADDYLKQHQQESGSVRKSIF